MPISSFINSSSTATHRNQSNTYTIGLDIIRRYAFKSTEKCIKVRLIKTLIHRTTWKHN